MICFIVGSVTGRGVKVWPEFTKNIHLQQGYLFGNGVGAKNILIYDSNIYQEKLIDQSLPDPWAEEDKYVARKKEKRRVIVFLIPVFFFILFVWAVWRAPMERALLLSFVPIFFLLTLLNYYWIMLLILPFSRKLGLAIGWLVINIAFGCVLIFTSGKAILISYGFLSWAMAFYFLAWLVWELGGQAQIRRQAKRRPASPVPPRSRSE